MSFSLGASHTLAQIIKFVSILFSNCSDSFFALNLHVLSLLFFEFFNFIKRRFQECCGLTLVGMS